MLTRDLFAVANLVVPLISLPLQYFQCMDASVSLYVENKLFLLDFF